MESMLEEQYVKFITGDAMMEPNIRIETNKKGFCHRHFSQMFEKGQKLPNALILESHLQEIIDNDMPKKLKGKPDKKQLEVIKKRLDSCYVCDRIEWDMHHFCDTIFVEWAKGEAFYKLYNEQPFICFKHYDFIMNVATQKSKLPSKLLPQFYAETAGLTKKYLLSLSGIGDKVADCILLFGAYRLEAFPVDTWIRQAMTNLYSTPQNPDKIREFAAGRFGRYAGFAQQLIFAAIRKNLI